MKRLYRLLLRLYPRDIRDQFESEMLAVLDASTRDATGAWHSLREAAGLLRGAIWERGMRVRIPPIAAGLLIAAATQWLLYSALLRLLRSASPVADRFDANSQLGLGLMAVAVLLLIIPLIVLLTRGVRREMPKQRVR